jgi:hypothetical protein
MKDLTQSVHELNALVEQFKFHEALDRFYDEDIITCENEEPPTVGMEAYKQSAKKYLDSISNPSATLKNVIVSDGISVCEWRYIFDHKEWGHWDKRWKDGKIVHERYYYSAG